MLEPVRVVSLTRQFSCRGTKSVSLAPFFTHNRCDIGGMAMPAISIFTVTSYWSSLPCANATCATGSMHTPVTAKRPRHHSTMLNRLAFIDLSLSGADTARPTAPYARCGLTHYSARSQRLEPLCLTRSRSGRGDISRRELTSVQRLRRSENV